MERFYSKHAAQATSMGPIEASDSTMMALNLQMSLMSKAIYNASHWCFKQRRSLFLIDILYINQANQSCIFPFFLLLFFNYIYKLQKCVVSLLSTTTKVILKPIVNVPCIFPKSKFPACTHISSHCRC